MLGEQVKQKSREAGITLACFSTSLLIVPVLHP
jgi:hypothetical protein